MCPRSRLVVEYETVQLDILEYERDGRSRPGAGEDGGVARGLGVADGKRRADVGVAPAAAEQAERGAAAQIDAAGVPFVDEFEAGDGEAGAVERERDVVQRAGRGLELAAADRDGAGAGDREGAAGGVEPLGERDRAVGRADREVPHRGRGAGEAQLGGRGVGDGGADRAVRLEDPADLRLRDRAAAEPEARAAERDGAGFRAERDLAQGDRLLAAEAERNAVGRVEEELRARPRGGRPAALPVRAVVPAVLLAAAGPGLGQRRDAEEQKRKESFHLVSGRRAGRRRGCRLARRRSSARRRWWRTCRSPRAGRRSSKCRGRCPRSRT